MPPRRFSRHEFTEGIGDADGNRYLTDREPFRYQVFSDTRIHTVRAGDTLFALAHRYFQPKVRASGFWWVIADFQPDPILDPTLALEQGRTLHVPSLRVLDELILSEQPRQG